MLRRAEGVWGLKNDSDPFDQKCILIADHPGAVYILKDSLQVARLSPDEAERLAECLVASAKRVRDAQDKDEK